jgi:hypothetical protein
MASNPNYPQFKPDNTAVINVRCSPAEKTSWENSFGFRNVSATVRRLLNAAAAKKLKRKSA